MSFVNKKPEKCVVPPCLDVLFDDDASAGFGESTPSIQTRTLLLTVERIPSIHGVATIPDQRISDQVIPSTQIR
jgi:hypothetical protein